MINTPVSVLAVRKDPRQGLYQDLKVVVISLNLVIHQSGPRELLSGSLVLSPAAPIVIVIVMSHHNITFKARLFIRFQFVSSANQITIIGNEMSV